ncbi:hypothetical protein [Desulfovibrio ferrophilus]|uniref:Quinohemoprotein amine dehydrogenase alpha subunit haem binding domain-containing protein n=1 Tax=Desulfovibrio ferrophilus TaxID=241368 RepID=A0A2Z6AYL0_9BACT|nr:hypothetical protein [Desulfovibrio ferrophilus]BBD08347.1 uncharacterized protein DFE_1621 [Desulfovibrio ferrophilus]
MVKILFGIALMGLCALVPLPVALAAGEAVTSSDAKASALVMERCILCHDTRRICESLGRKGKDGWDKTVTRMIGKGAPVGPEQKQLIVDWLWILPEGSAPVCPEGQ